MYIKAELQVDFPLNRPSWILLGMSSRCRLVTCLYCKLQKPPCGLVLSLSGVGILTVNNTQRIQTEILLTWNG